MNEPLQLGQKFIVAQFQSPKLPAKLFEVEVLRVGRDYVYYGERSAMAGRPDWERGRFLKRDWEAGTVSYAYPSLEAYHTKRLETEHRSQLNRKLRDFRNPLDAAPIDVIRQIAALLNIELSDPEKATVDA